MADQSCSRCNHAEYIPTWQFVRFDDRTRYLCTKCYEELRTWAARRSSVRVSRYVPIS